MPRGGNTLAKINMIKKNPVIAVVGRGYIGSAFLFYPNATMLDATDAAKAGSSSMLCFMQATNAVAVVNAAGYCGVNNVDDCDEDPVKTWEANTLLPIMLADCCKWLGVPLHHISTGCVFDGAGREEKSPFREYEKPNCIAGQYRKSKFAGEAGVLEILPSNSWCYRVRMPFDKRESPRNLICKVRKFAKVVDAVNSITYVPDLVEAVVNCVIERRAPGIYNMVNPYPISIYEVARIVAEQWGHSNDGPERMTPQDLDSICKGVRTNCILSTAKAEAAEFKFRPTLEAINQSLAKPNNLTT
jgi:dTDP-4-dehydrorhamnose reductase